MLLGASVWLIYLTDHLADGYFSPNIYDKAFSVKFFRKHRLYILGFAFLLLLLIIFLSFHADRKILLFGMPGGIVVMAYLWMNQWQVRYKKNIVPREMIISIVYIYGTAGYPFLSAKSYFWTDYVFLTGFLFLVTVNVLIYSWFGTDPQKGSDFPGFVVRFGSDTTLRVIRILLFSAALFFLVTFGVNRTGFSIIGLLMCAGFWFILGKPEYMRKENRYGVLADLVFILPSLALFF